MRRLLFLILTLAASACSTNNRDVPQSANPETCTPMPNECPAQMICSVSTVGNDRVCTGAACCQPFCEANGCTSCCATTSP